ncbi:hypothetical protein BJX76DRAFT_231567 [Aspergillus varians]
MTQDTSQRALITNASEYIATGYALGPSRYAVDPVVKSNVYNSLFNSDGGKQWPIPQYLCSSVNYTWDPIVSLLRRITSILRKCHESSSKVVQCHR